MVTGGLNPFCADETFIFFDTKFGEKSQTGSVFWLDPGEAPVDVFLFECRENFF